MAVLLRSMGSYKDVYERVLKSKGIPVRCPVRKGCFDAFEVKMVLEFLSVIDNPRQDIPLTAVLKNMFHMSEEEIAQIKLAGGLEKGSESTYLATDASGEPILEADSTDIKKSALRQGYLEAANVNVADEMVNLIVAQRAYEMNSKAITASDEMLQQANQLKR